MDDAYDCEYDMVENPIEMLERAHARIRELEAEHASEIERMRLTDAEREAIVWAARAADPDYTGHTATLRSLLERLG